MRQLPLFTYLLLLVAAFGLGLAVTILVTTHVLAKGGAEDQAQPTMERPVNVPPSAPRRA